MGILFRFSLYDCVPSLFCLKIRDSFAIHKLWLLEIAKSK